MNTQKFKKWLEANKTTVDQQYNSYNNMGKPSQSVTREEWYEEAYYLENGVDDFQE